MSVIQPRALAEAFVDITGAPVENRDKDPHEIIQECLRTAPQMRLPCDWRQTHVHMEELPVTAAIVAGKGKVLSLLANVCNKECPAVIAKDLTSDTYRSSIMLVCWLGDPEDTQATSAWLRRFVGMVDPPFVIANTTSKGVYAAAHLYRFMNANAG